MPNEKILWWILYHLSWIRQKLKTMTDLAYSHPHKFSNSSPAGY